MAYSSNILLGRITKVSGYEGAATVKLEKIFSENIPRMESVFLEIDERLVPFFISDVEYTGADVLKIKLEGYNSADKMAEFIGCRVFLTTELPDNDQSQNVNLLTGYKVFTGDKVLLGSVTEIIPSPGQWLLNILTDRKKEILVPFHENLIIRIDKRKKIILMDIPDGLAEIN